MSTATMVPVQRSEADTGPGPDAPTSRAYRGVPIAAPGRCPYSRSFSKWSGEYTIELGYDALGELMDDVFGVWDSLKLDARDEQIGNLFEALVERIGAMQDWTGWGGVPGIYTGATG